MSKTDPYQKHYSNRWKRVVHPEGDTPVFKLAAAVVFAYVSGVLSLVLAQHFRNDVNGLIVLGIGWVATWLVAFVIYIAIRRFEERLR